MEKVACRVVHWIFRRTGKHLFLTDDDEGQPPLLQRMVEDHGDLYFISALRAFKRRVVYANADCDRILIICYIYNFLCGIRTVCFIVVYSWLVFFNARNQILLAGEHHLLGETLSCLRYSY